MTADHAGIYSITSGIGPTGSSDPAPVAVPLLRAGDDPTGGNDPSMLPLLWRLIPQPLLPAIMPPSHKTANRSMLVGFFS